MPFIEERKIPKVFNLLIVRVEKYFGHTLMPVRLLLWYPKALIGSLVLEGLITHKDAVVSKRMLKLIRMQVSVKVNCGFCIDMNSSGFQQDNITQEEIRGMQGRIKINDIPSFTMEEKLVIYYARSLSRSPIHINPRLIQKMQRVFGQREYVVIVTTIAQVDYWTRLIQGLGIKPAGFMDECELNIFNEKNSIKKTL